MTLFIHGATVNAGEDELFAVGLVEVNACFDEPERVRYVIDDAVDELVEIEKRVDLM